MGSGYFGADDESYNIQGYDEVQGDGTGRPGIGIAANAIQFWALRQGQLPTIGQAAAVFNMPAEAVAEAVDWHPWMMRHDEGPLAEQRIDHDGE